MKHTQFRIDIYSDWVVDFDIDEKENVEVRRYKKSSRRPKKPTEYLNVNVLRLMGLLLNKEAIGQMVYDQIVEHQNLYNKVERRVYED